MTTKVTGSMIETATIDTANLVNLSVTALKLASGAALQNIGVQGVTNPFIADNNVTPAKLTQPFTQATVLATTSGTAKDFTGIPSWAKRITVIFTGVSTSGSSLVRVQLGNGSIVTTGYVAGGTQAGTGAVAGTSTAGFDFTHGAPSASDVKHGHLFLTNSSGYTWTACWVIANTNNGYTHQGGGSLTLSSALDRVRLTTVNGTDTFDAGSVNIMYE